MHEHNLNRIPHTHTHTYAHNTQIQDTHIINHTPQHIHMHREQQYTYMQHIQDNTEQENREQYTQDNAQPQHTCSAHNYRTYSLDYYFEYAYIKNSNTIEIYTILK